MLRNHLKEPGHTGPVPGAAHTFILAGGRFQAVSPLHLSDVSLLRHSPRRLPSSLPSPFFPSSPPVLPPSSGLLFSSTSFPTSEDSGMEARVWTLCVLVALQLRWTQAQAQTNYSR